jgi:nicotinate-nucleotide pyrophosphorylase (carboxylating)
LTTSVLREAVARALAEDAVADDVTTHATVAEHATGRARLVARERCVVAGTDAFVEAMRQVDDRIGVEVLAPDGTAIEAGTAIASLAGPLRGMLSAERVALNFVQRLSGIATLTRAFVDAAGAVAILDTRKTTPGLRALEKAAVVAGGGRNHRPDLESAFLIKDNHIHAAGSITAAIRAARAAGELPIEVECDTLDQVGEALDAGAEHVLLDNMDPATLREAVALAGGRARLEASGGVTLDNVAAIAATGVDEISVGALTHSARAIDLSLELEAG